MQPVIKVENLSKLYKLGRSQHRADSISDLLVETAQGLFHRRNKTAEEFWALRDVSFEVQPGEVVGIIGRNGAGKSTLLKILARITEPTSGRAVINGRVGSLLEVGTGFHPELTGRDNIYLNGAILGMHRAEIDRKFDEIVAFSEIEKFLDTSVKRYSSGMYVRLAFAVAAHLEPEILLVDEVLAVGDVAFQKKSLGKMGEVAKEGRTVLFVSHNMAAVNYLCDRALVLIHGKIFFEGTSKEATNLYSNTGFNSHLVTSMNIRDRERTKGNGRVTINQVTLLDSANQLAASFSIWEPFAVEMEIMSKDFPLTASMWIIFNSSTGSRVLSAFQYDDDIPMTLRSPTNHLRVYIDPNIFSPGIYSISVGSFGKYNEFYDWVDNAIQFEIFNEFITGKPFDHRLGETTMKFRWELL